MSKSFMSSLLANVPAAASIAADGTSSAEFSSYVDTGSYMLNAALSGSLFGGMPNNKITVFAGESSTGKTFFILGILTTWMQENPDGLVVYFDTESAVTNKMLQDHNLDINRVIKVEPDTIERFRESAVKILDNYSESKSARPMIMVLDSLGNLSSRKEVEDIQNQKDARDMTKPQLIRGAFRVLRLRLARLGVPMIVANHTYAVVGAYIPTKIMSGGGGLVYVSDSIAMLSKSKVRDKDDKKVVVGADITVEMVKSRLSRENTKTGVRISYGGGLDRYHGLLEVGVDAGLITGGAAGRYTFEGHITATTSRKIAEAPEEFFTEEFLRKLDEQYIKPRFSYGNTEPLDIADGGSDADEL